MGGVPEVIDDGVNGFLFDPYVEGDLAQRVNQILEKPEVLQDIFTGARNSNIERMEDHVLKLEDLYCRALSDNLRNSQNKQ